MKRTMICQSTAQQKKKQQEKRGWTMCPAPVWDAAYCRSQGWNQTPLKCRCSRHLSIIDALFSIMVLAISDEQLLRDGIDILVQYFFKKKSQPNFQCAAACCGMLQPLVVAHSPYPCARGGPWPCIVPLGNCMLAASIHNSMAQANASLVQTVHRVLRVVHRWCCSSFVV